MQLHLPLFLAFSWPVAIVLVFFVYREIGSSNVLLVVMLTFRSSDKLP
jgi:UPF0716 family protein affecting phage T7 exclusion